MLEITIEPTEDGKSLQIELANTTIDVVKKIQKVFQTIYNVAATWSKAEGSNIYIIMVGIYPNKGELFSDVGIRSCIEYSRVVCNSIFESCQPGYALCNHDIVG